MVAPEDPAAQVARGIRLAEQRRSCAGCLAILALFAGLLAFTYTKSGELCLGISLFGFALAVWYYNRR